MQLIGLQVGVFDPASIGPANSHSGGMLVVDAQDQPPFVLGKEPIARTDGIDSLCLPGADFNSRPDGIAIGLCTDEFDHQCVAFFTGFVVEQSERILLVHD